MFAKLFERRGRHDHHPFIDIAFIICAAKALIEGTLCPIKA
jgi:hypothetical protein